MLVRRADYLRSGPFGSCRVPATEIADAAQGVAKVLLAPEQQQETARPMAQPQSGSPMSTANASVLPSERTPKRAISLGFLCGPEEHFAALLGWIDSEIVKAKERSEVSL
jgi:hypothetical protein